MPDAPEVPAGPASAPAAELPSYGGDKVESIRWKYAPHAIAFISGLCVMTVELVAGRLIGRHLGSSLYTWTSIIGVVLAGISIGNYVGGRMADRWKPESVLGWLFLYSSMAVMTTLALNNYFAGEKPLTGVVWPARVFISVLTIFMLPALILGTISPVTAKMALANTQAIGRTIGSVYAWNTVGSILGTLATGFFLVSMLGAQGVVMVVALGLGLVGLVLGPRRYVHAVWIAVVLLLIYISSSSSETLKPVANRLGLRDAYRVQVWYADRGEYVWEGRWGEYPFARDGDYQFVKVSDGESSTKGKQPIRLLTLDYLIHGYVDLTNPRHLEYDYEHIYADAARRFAQGRQAIQAFFLGGGAYTFPRWVEQEWPGSSCDVAEIDPLVLEANHVALGLPRDTAIRTFIGDARNVVDDLPLEPRYDLIFGDAFNDLSVPWHLTTVEFTRSMKERLKPGGALLVNVIDDWDHALLLGAYVNTLRVVFKHVYVFTTETTGVRSGRETFVVAASDRGVDFTDVQPGHEADFKGSLLSQADLETLAEKSGRRVLTDDDAPVENLLEPVVRNRK